MFDVRHDRPRLGPEPQGQGLDPPPEVFTDPERYDPNRFAPPREEHKQAAHALIGFGGGRHRCLGMHFAYIGTSKNSIRGIFRIAKQKCDFCFASFLKQLPVREMGSMSLRCWALRINRSAHMQIEVLWSVLLARFAWGLISPPPAPDYGSWVTGPRAPWRRSAPLGSPL